MNYEKIKRFSLSETDGKIFCIKQPFKSVGMHWHDFYEIELVLSGQGEHNINGRLHDFKRGTMYLMRLNDSHEIRLDSEIAVNYKVQIPPSFIPENILQIIMLANGDLTVNLTEDQLKQMELIYTLIENQKNSNSRYDSLLTEHLICSMILMFIELSDVSIIPTYSHSNERIRKIIYFVHQNFKENITVESIAEHFYLNKNYLCTFFKDNTGMTILNYIKELRLKYAARLAVTTDLKSIEICELCGYTSISNFLRDFKAEYNISPLKMRKENRSNTKS